MPVPIGLAVAALSRVGKGVAARSRGPLRAGKRAPGRRRRRRTRLTQGERLELSWIATTLGKTSAASALPFYLGRGG